LKLNINIKEIDEIIKNSLSAFVDKTIKIYSNICREREAVSFYAFGPLLKQVNQNTFLYDPNQITIEFPVPQIDDRSKNNLKEQVCKDIVLWHKPLMTCWDKDKNPTILPSVILEWKFGNLTKKQYEYDIDWLKKYSENNINFIGYAIKVKCKNYLLVADKIYNSIVYKDWLVK